MSTAAVVPVTKTTAPSGETYQERAKGKDVRTSNIVAAKAVADAIRTSLGPRGMDKLVQLADGRVLISNDGATVLSNMKVLHPAAKMLVECSKAQDVEAGDGTTTVVVLAGALLEATTALSSKGIHPTQIAGSFLQAAEEACAVLEAAARPVNLRDRHDVLSAVRTCLSSKVVAENADVLAPIAVDSVLGLLTDRQWRVASASAAEAGEKNGGGNGGGGAAGGADSAANAAAAKLNVDLRDIRVVHQMGGTVDDTELVDGLVLSKGSAKTAGGPSAVQNAKIALLQYCLSAPKTDMDNSVVVQDYAAMDRILREERKYILNLCKQIKRAGANVVLLQKSILRDAYNELSLHFLSKMNIMVCTDIDRADIDFICHTTGCQPIAHPDQCTRDKLGHADSVRDVWMEGGSNKVVKFTGVGGNSGDSSNSRKKKTVTVLLRGSNELVLEEAARSLHDAQCVVRSLVKQRAIIAGGGAAEMEAAIRLQEKAVTMSSGKDAYCWSAFGRALEVVPYTLSENAGLKAVEQVTELRRQHAADGSTGAGVNVRKRCVTDMYEHNVVQPLLVSTSAIRLAAETVAMIMKVDDLIVVK